MVLRVRVLVCALLIAVHALADGVQYVVGIHKQPRPLVRSRVPVLNSSTQRQSKKFYDSLLGTLYQVPGVRTVPMTSLTGQRFICSLPDVSGGDEGAFDLDAIKQAATSAILAQTHPSKAAAAAATAAATSTPTLAPAKSAEAVLFERLRRGLRGKCFERTEGYWSYEVCPFVAVRQFHRQPGAPADAPRNPLFSLGTHVTRLNAVFSSALVSTASDAASPASSSSPAKPYMTVYDATMAYPPKFPIEPSQALLNAHQEVRQGAAAAQFFEGGSNNRHAAVYFRCPAATASADAGAAASAAATTLVGVHEPRAFSYVLVVETPHACAPALVAERKKQVEEERSTAGAAFFLRALQAKAAQPSGHYCAQLLAGWWTYEFCVHRAVRQFHAEPVTPASKDGSPPPPPPPGTQVPVRIVAEFSLGTFQGDPNGRLVVPPQNKYTNGLGGLGGGLKLNALPGDQNARAAEHRPYISYEYIGGTPCDLDAKNAPRRTEVR